VVSSTSTGRTSQSCQYAPFDDDYNWKNGSSNAHIYDTTISNYNSYRGGPYQEAVSGLTDTNQTAYEGNGGGFSIYGVEYQPGPDGYVIWVSNGKPSWALYASAVGPNSIVNISQRPIPQEPLYIIMNLGISPSFGYISPNLPFPATMLIDYVRVYQDPNNRNVGCNPAGFPTEAYINQYIDAYTNPNYTTWKTDGSGGSFNQSFPKNSLIDQC